MSVVFINRTLPPPNDLIKGKFAQGRGARQLQIDPDFVTGFACLILQPE
jgi:hypothetical protein